MLLSLQHNFIFIHVYRTGGTSIRAALEPFSHRPERSFLRKALKRIGIEPSPQILPYRSRDFYKHIRAKELASELPPGVFDHSFKFAFVRNPWDFQVSMYHYILSNPRHFFYRQVRSLSGFEQYAEWVSKNYRKLQKDFVADEKGNLLVDFLGRFENLPHDFDAVCSTIGISAELPAVNGTRHRDYRSYYTDHSRRLIEEHFREDVDFFGYSFD